MLHSIPKAELTLEERGLPDNSFFEANLKSGAVHSEVDTNWSDMSEEVEVELNGEMKKVRTCSHDIKTLTVTHGDLSVTVNAKPGEKLYQYIRAQTTFFPGGSSVDEMIGRAVGKVKDGKIIEEKYIDVRTNEILGFKI